MAKEQAVAEKPGRLAVIDALRGLAVALMIVYHVAWDMDFLGLARIPMYTDRFWLGLRQFIPTLFLGLVGVSLVLAHRRGLRVRPFLKRLAALVAAAGAVTAASYIVFPATYIFFGVLHGIALGSILGLAFLSAPLAVVLAAAAFCYAAPVYLANPFFDQPWLQWLGLMTYFPDTNDYVPLFPWFGAVLAGIAAGRLALARGPLPAVIAWRPRAAPWRLLGRLLGRLPGRLLGWAGRHALIIYLVHQPLLLGGLYLWLVL